MNRIDYYENKNRFEKSSFMKTVNEKLEIGEGVKKIIMKYFKSELLRTKSKQPDLKTSPIGYQDFQDWQRITGRDPDSWKDWALELMGNFHSYYDPIDVAYIQLGFNTYTDFDSFISRLITDEQKKEAIYGGSYAQFQYGLRNIEKFRQMGIELYKFAMKYWKGKYGQPPRPIKAKSTKTQRQKQKEKAKQARQKGRGVDYEDFKNYLLKYKIDYPKRKSPTVFIKQFKKELADGKVGDFFNMKDYFSYYLATQFQNRIFQQSKPLLGEVL